MAGLPSERVLRESRLWLAVAVLCAAVGSCADESHNGNTAVPTTTAYDNAVTVPVTASLTTLQTPDQRNDTAGFDSDDFEATTATEMQPVEVTTRDLVQDLQPLLAGMQRNLYPIISAVLVDEGLSSECVKSLVWLMRDLQHQKKWALMMVTSIGTLPINPFLGGSGALGSFDQCLEVERRDEYTNELSLQGQYCVLFIRNNRKLVDGLRYLLKDDDFFRNTLVKFKVVPRNFLDIPIALKFGLCTPSLCTVQELNYTINKYFSQPYEIDAEIDNCRIKGEKTPDPFQKFVIGLGFVLLALVLAGTAADSYLNRARDPPVYENSWFLLTFIMMFSATRNLRRLFVPYTEETKELGFLNGIKVILAFWVIYGHNAIFTSPDTFVNLTGYVRLLRKISFQVVANAFVSVSCFFFISGFLLAYLCMKERARLVKQNPVLIISIMFIRRYIRLVTPLLVVLCFSMMIPLWTFSPNDTRSVFEMYTRRCPKNWWGIPALASNFLGGNAMCLGHSWYVAVDMQIFVVAAYLVALILRWPRTGLLITGALSFASCLFATVVTYANGYPPVLGFTSDTPDLILETFDNVYMQPATHAGCYLLGVLCAYVCFHHGTRLRWYTELVCWLAAHTCSAYVLFITVIWYRSGFPGDVGKALYAGFHRQTFTLALAWLMYACLHGMAPNVRLFLQHSGFRALGRLAFGTFLVHFAVIYMKQGLWRTPAFYPDQFLLLSSTMGVIGMSVALALLLNIGVESPVAHLDNYVFKKLMNRFVAQSKTEKEVEADAQKTEMALALDQRLDPWRTLPTPPHYAHQQQQQLSPRSVPIFVGDGSDVKSADSKPDVNGVNSKENGGRLAGLGGAMGLFAKTHSKHASSAENGDHNRLSSPFTKTKL